MTAGAGRLHALDNLRALMMWLGIVLHVAAIHLLRDSPLPWADERRTRVADLLVAFIHAFRMPTFFILAGFFVAMLLQSRGPAGLARHRLRRLGLPFAVFWPPVFVAVAVTAALFMHRIERGTWGLDPQVAEAHMRGLHLPVTPDPVNTVHMWFLWLLLWMSLATALLARFVPAAAWAASARWLRLAVCAWWGPFVLAVPLLVSDGGYPKGFLYLSGSFLPPWAEWLHHGVYFVAGLAMHGARDEMFASLQRRWKGLAAAGAVAFLVAGACMEAGLALPFAFTYSVTSWLWSFALIGAAVRHLPQRSAILAYAADSSYWVYLVHMPLTIAFGATLFGADLPALVKMALNIAATTAVCLVTYQLAVRSTWVGVLLNGKRHRAGAPPLQEAPAS